MIKHPLLKAFAEWRKEHPDEDYQADEIHEFLADFSRGDIHSFLLSMLSLTEY